MTDDKRMYFLRNIELLQNDSIESQDIEYEVITDANIIGNIKYGPYFFTMWELSNKREGEDRKVCLRIRNSKDLFNGQHTDSINRSGFYHGGGIADELVSLASLFLRRRLKLGSMVRVRDYPMMPIKDDKWFDKDLVTGSSTFIEIEDWLKLVEGLNKDIHQKFILAVRLYQQALLLIEQQPDIAYLNLVSSIETLCQNYKIDAVPLSEVNSKLAKLIESIDNEELRKEIEKTLLNRERFIKRRFVAFILNHTEEDFWNNEEEQNIGKVNREDLPKLLERIYDQRSATLHYGQPFPPYVFLSPMQNEEINFSGGVISGEKKWESKDFIPNPHFFEKLVNHVVKTYLKRNQIERKEKDIQ